MIQDYEDVQRCSRKCAATQRELQAGEPYYSVLHVEGSRVQRSDYCEEAWGGPPPNALGWWKSSVPGAGPRQPQAAPNDVILQYFQQLERSPELADERYVLALLLVRRRVLRVEEDPSLPTAPGEWALVHPADETRFVVSVQEPDPIRLQEIQVTLSRLLFSDAAGDAADAGKDAACEDR